METYEENQLVIALGREIIYRSFTLGLEIFSQLPGNSCRATQPTRKNVPGSWDGVTLL